MYTLLMGPRNTGPQGSFGILAGSAKYRVWQASVLIRRGTAALSADCCAPGSCRPPRRRNLTSRLTKTVTWGIDAVRGPDHRLVPRASSSCCADPDGHKSDESGIEIYHDVQSIHADSNTFTRRALASSSHSASRARTAVHVPDPPYVVMSILHLSTAI